MFCTQCGQQNPDESRFCGRCGAQLPSAPSATPGPGLTETTSTISLSALEGLDVPRTGDGGDGTHGGEAGVEPPPAGTALLVVKRGPNAGSRFLLDADVTTAGRHPESDIFLDDVTVSRRHAEFVRESGPGGTVFSVRDVGSLNGTYLDRERIESVRLAGGDEVQIGKYRLVFLAGPTGEHG